MPHPPRPSLEEIFHAALECEATLRDAYVTDACEGDEDLLRRAQALLAAHQDADAFLETPLVEPGEPLNVGPGTHIGPYKLLQEIGEGGMGVVYMAEQEHPVRRKVALKVIKLGMDTKQVIARFEAERQALALMEHPNIARVLDAGATEAGRPYFVMELVRGVAINEYCDTHHLATRERIALFIDTCRAVQHAHQKGIIHRDIKPGNVLVTSHDGTPVVKIIDFGVAKATNQKLTEKTLFTEFRQFIGTPEYMSPEQAEMSGLDVDTRTDIYSLGVLFYQLLAGSTPFDGKTLRGAGYEEMTRMIREDEPQTPSTRLSQLGDPLAALARSHGSEPSTLVKLLRGDLDWIVMKAISKDRTRRYDSASELADDVGRHLRNEPVLAGPPSSVYRMRKLVQRNRLLVSAVSLATLGILAGLGLALSGYFAAKAEAERSNKVSGALTEMLSVVGSSDGLELDVREVLATAREAFGEDHATVAATLAAMAGQLRNTSDFEGAEELYAEALAIYRETFGPEHPNVGRTLGSLGFVQSVAGKFDEAHSALTESLRIEALRPGQALSYGCSTRRELAQLLAKRGHYAEADALLEQALVLLRAAPKIQHLQIVTVLEERLILAVSNPGQGDLDPIYLEMVQAVNQAFPPGHLFHGKVLHGRAYYLATHGRMKEAIPIFEEALAILESIDNPPPSLEFSALDMLYQCVRAQGQKDKWREADQVLIKFIRQAPKLWSIDEPRYGQNLEAAAGMFYEHGRLSLALEVSVEYIRFAGRNADEATLQLVTDRITALIWDTAIDPSMTPADFGMALQLLEEFPTDGSNPLRTKILRAALNARLGQPAALTETLANLGELPDDVDEVTHGIWTAATEHSERLSQSGPPDRD